MVGHQSGHLSQHRSKPCLLAMRPNFPASQKPNSSSGNVSWPVGCCLPLTLLRLPPRSLNHPRSNAASNSSPVGPPADCPEGQFERSEAVFPAGPTTAVAGKSPPSSMPYSRPHGLSLGLLCGHGTSHFVCYAPTVMEKKNKYKLFCIYVQTI